MKEHQQQISLKLDGVGRKDITDLGPNYEHSIVMRLQYMKSDQVYQ
jgi:hypothetical protein